MPEPTKAELAGEITKQLQELLKDFAAFREITNLRVNLHEGQLADRVRVDDTLQQKLAELMSKVATIEERSRALEKLSDRGWQVWLALVGAGLALLVALLRK